MKTDTKQCVIKYLNVLEKLGVREDSIYSGGNGFIKWIEFSGILKIVEKLREKRESRHN